MAYLADDNVFAAATRWLDNILLGSIASAIAVIAVASIGFLLLWGRMDMRRAIEIILGCFILFGASSIAAGSGTAGPIAAASMV